MTFLGPYDGKQSLYGEILDVFCKKSEHWLPTGVGHSLQGRALEMSL